MSLNVIEMSDVIQYIDSIEDKKIHDLLHKMQFEYQDYMDIGTVEDCRNYKRLCDIPMSQVNQFIQLSSQALVSELDALKRENEFLKNPPAKKKKKEIKE